jgi:2-oxoglutarate dehydrogenase E1 component
VWLRQAIETGTYRVPLSAEEKKRLLTRLSEVEGFERYMRRAFLGQKSFSIEGLDALVPMLDSAIELAAEDGAHEVVMGMAHRGRLNVLAHVIGRPYETILREFEGERSLEALSAQPAGSSGDVKYHLGAEGRRKTPSGDITVSLAANPSHLEAVDPVVEGLTRSEQTDRSTRDGAHDPRVALPILIHGDASFPGQGVVAETLNLQGLGGYSTGGTLHIIANNQVGFTTDPADGRSTRYSSDLAKGFDVPIVHVNADDPEAAVYAIRLSLAFRRRFGHDVVVDLVGYRRFGHNEGDEPAYTQPLMVDRIQNHPTAREQYAEQLIGEGVVTQEEADELVAQVDGRLRAAHEALKATFGAPTQPPREGTPPTNGSDAITAVDADVLRELNSELLEVPDRFTIHPKLKRQLDRRLEAIDQGKIDWGQAEALAFSSLLVEAIPIRFTGQDTERGTFSNRHLVLHDPNTGEQYTPMKNLDDGQASFEVYNSPLSEYACLGFEYGYSVGAPEALVIWEAQYGDFVNGAQIVLDQFVVSGLSKWGQTSRLTLLLPHGYEGNGPEHSSARLERFLQLAAQENIRIANPSTAAQYFHLLRRQALDPNARPLVVMTPKGLLRLKEASGALEQLAEGRFEPILDDRLDHQQVRRLVLTSGKLYYDIAGHDARGEHPEVALARLEQLYPFPTRAAADIVAAYPALEEVVWAQEEPQNMGAWRAIRHRLEEAIAGRVPLRYVGRPWRASPSEGYPTAHLREQERIVNDVLSPAESAR